MQPIERYSSPTPLGEEFQPTSLKELCIKYFQKESCRTWENNSFREDQVELFLFSQSIRNQTLVEALFKKFSSFAHLWSFLLTIPPDRREEVKICALGKSSFAPSLTNDASRMVLECFPKIHYLDISSSPISDLSFLDNHQKLLKIIAFNSHIERLPNNCTELRDLRLYKCSELENLESLNHSKKITELYLGYLSIKEIPIDLPCLRTLDIRGCSNLTDLSRLIAPSLQRICITACPCGPSPYEFVDTKTSTRPSGFKIHSTFCGRFFFLVKLLFPKECPNLQEIEVEGVPFELSSESLDNFPSLQKLSLKNCFLDRLPKNCPHLETVDIFNIDLTDKEITPLDDSPSLKVFRANYCELTRSPKNCPNLHTVEMLSL